EDAQWRHFAETSTRHGEDGGLRFHYDPSIAEAFRAAPLHDINLWPQWERITCPTLVLRGEESSFLTPETLQQMEKSGPPMESVTVPGCGHAPALMDRYQIELITEWLQRQNCQRPMSK